MENESIVSVLSSDDLSLADGDCDIRGDECRNPSDERGAVAAPHSKASPGKQEGAATPDREVKEWILAHPEFTSLAARFDRLDVRRERAGLALGALAEHTLKRYSREINPGKLARVLAAILGRPISRSKILDHRAAFRMYRLLRQQCDGQPPHLEVTKLAKAWQSGPGHFTDADKVALCQRAAKKGLSRSRGSVKSCVN